MINIKATLLKIVGRLKKRMDAVFLTMGGILISLGFYIKIEYTQADDYGTASVLVGLVMWVLAYFFVKKKEKRERIERQEERQETHKLLNGIYQELLRLHRDKDEE